MLVPTPVPFPSVGAPYALAVARPPFAGEDERPTFV